jgi:molecular chaperone DnaK (HSP70)
MKKVFGIDLGTTYSAIATLDENGLPEVIENFSDSIPLLASAVYFPEDGPIVVGKSAKNQAEVEANRVVQYVKREIGKKEPKKWNFDGKEYDAISISSFILKRLKEYAEDQGYEVEDVVITCPANFGNEERTATKQAGEIAGLNVLNIINEPSAAALNYCYREFKENKKIMVYDLGGGTFDVSLIDFCVDEKGVATIDIIDSKGNPELGGIDWDRRLFEHMCDLYSEVTGIKKEEMDTELIYKINSQVEDTKRSLSNLQSKSLTIHYSDDSTRIDVTRTNFEEQTRDLVEQTMDFVHQILKEEKISTNDVDVVLLVGGSTRMPMIKSAVEGLFPGKVRFEHPDLAVAKGAALSAAIEYIERITKGKEGEGEGVVEGKEAGLMAMVTQRISTVNDKLTRSLGPAIYLEDDSYRIDNLLFVGDKTPAEATAIYGTRERNQEELLVQVFENVQKDRLKKYVIPSFDQYGMSQYTDPALKVKKIGEVRLELPPNTRMGCPIQVVFRSSTIGLEVSATNIETGESANTVITSINTKTEEEVTDERERLATIQTSGQIGGNPKNKGVIDNGSNDKKDEEVEGW